MTTKAYRIVEEPKYGVYKTLFHGLPVAGTKVRSRLLCPGVWYEAEERQVVDGGGQTPYLSGFNVLMTRDAAHAYLRRFTASRNLVVVEVQVEGLRPKPTNANVMLAKRMKIVG